MADADIAATKVCGKCKQEKPYGEFSASIRARDGKHLWCKPCDRAAASARARLHPERTRSVKKKRRDAIRERGPDPSITSQVCTTCCTQKQASAFGVTGNTRHGLRKQCKECERTAAKIWTAANVKRVAEKKRAWRQANKQRIAETLRDYRKNNPDKIGAIQRKHLAKLAQEDPARLKEYRRVGWANRRAREKAAPGRFSRADVLRMTEAQGGRCWYCLKKVEKLEVEHRIPLSRGGSNDPSNLVMACGSCNKRKMTKMPWELETPRLI